MDTYQIEIIEPGAKRLLDDMAELELISILPLNAERDSNSDERRAEIVSLAGTWSEMSEIDFSEYLTEANSVPIIDRGHF
ncbi:MAG: hypothetical protein ABL999_12555 [Pyrinomonadaceae bacterium]